MSRNRFSLPISLLCLALVVSTGCRQRYQPPPASEAEQTLLTSDTGEDNVPQWTDPPTVPCPEKECPVCSPNATGTTNSNGDRVVSAIGICQIHEQDDETSLYIENTGVGGTVTANTTLAFYESPEIGKDALIFLDGKACSVMGMLIRHGEGEGETTEWRTLQLLVPTKVE